MKGSFDRRYVRSELAIKDDSWYEAIADALQVLGKRWYSDTTEEEDAFILAYADELAERPEAER
jgi:hypothetical protein